MWNEYNNIRYLFLISYVDGFLIILYIIHNRMQTIKIMKNEIKNLISKKRIYIPV
jgi:hypothetical protein